MPVDLKISDDDLKGFSAEARDHLRDAVAEYAMDLIEEANRVEAGRNSTTGPPEVTRAMVNDAKVLLRRGLGAPRRNTSEKILRVTAAVLSLVVGFMYDETRLQSGGYMAIFVLLVAAAILTVTISTLKE